MALVSVTPLQAEGDPVLTLTAPAVENLGEPMQIVGTLHDADGAPIPDVVLDFFIRAEILNNRALVSIGDAVTNEAGVAALTYAARQSGLLFLQARLAETDTLPAIRVQLEVDIVGDQQLFSESVGTDAPPFELWALVGLIATVWLLLVSVTLRIYVIARRGSDEAPVEAVPYHFRTRGEWP